MKLSQYNYIKNPNSRIRGALLKGEGADNPALSSDTIYQTFRSISGPRNAVTFFYAILKNLLIERPFCIPCTQTS